MSGIHTKDAGFEERIEVVARLEERLNFLSSGSKKGYNILFRGNDEDWRIILIIDNGEKLHQIQPILADIGGEKVCEIVVGDSIQVLTQAIHENVETALSCTFGVPITNIMKRFYEPVLTLMRMYCREKGIAVDANILSDLSFKAAHSGVGGFRNGRSFQGGRTSSFIDYIQLMLRTSCIVISQTYHQHSISGLSMEDFFCLVARGEFSGIKTVVELSGVDEETLLSHAAILAFIEKYGKGFLENAPTALLLREIFG